MGALDAEAKKYLGKKSTFADAFNFLLYNGEQVIDPDAAFFLKKAANLDLEFEVEDGGRMASSGRQFCADRSGA